MKNAVRSEMIAFRVRSPQTAAPYFAPSFDLDTHQTDRDLCACAADRAPAVLLPDASQG